MLQERAAGEVQAEASSDETRQFAPRVRRVTPADSRRRRNMRVVLERFRSGVKVSELCRREGIRPNVYYTCLKDFIEAGKARPGNSAPCPIT